MMLKRVLVILAVLGLSLLGVNTDTGRDLACEIIKADNCPNVQIDDNGGQDE